jgi:hypothetical protein
MTGEPKNWSEHERELDEYEPGSVAMSATLFATFPCFGCSKNEMSSSTVRAGKPHARCPNARLWDHHASRAKLSLI